MSSVWEQVINKRTFNSLSGDMRTDVLIIGGGMAGLLCAYELRRAGVDYALVEAETIGDGISKNTTAKITSQHGLIYDKLISKFGLDMARQYIDINELALSRYRGLCARMDCDFEEKDSYVYSMDNRKKIEKELSALQKIGYNAEFADKVSLPFSIAGAVRFRNQAQFNPLKFIYHISEGLNIYEHTRVRELKGTTAICNNGKIMAKKIIIATHFPIINKHGAYFLKMYQHRSYVIALENAENTDGMYVSEAKCGMSFRTYKNLLLLGGGAHRTGKSGGNWAELREFAKRTFPKAAEKYHWAAQDCMTLDDVPYIGLYSEGTENMYVATGFNKWGMTSSMAAAMILCDMVQEKKNEYTELFSPSRTILRPQLASNAFESALGLLSLKTKRCPHLGCALKWNPHEHSWDCPCHGSRFSEDGKLIDNPATENLK